MLDFHDFKHYVLSAWSNFFRRLFITIHPSLGAFSTLALLWTPCDAMLHGSAGYGRQSKDCSPSASLRSALFRSTQRYYASLRSDLPERKIHPKSVTFLGREYYKKIETCSHQNLTIMRRPRRTILSNMRGALFFWGSFTVFALILQIGYLVAQNTYEIVFRNQLMHIGKGKC